MVKFREIQREWILLAVISAMIIAFSLLSPAFIKWENFMDLLKSNVVLGIAAVGMMVIILSGEIDASVASIIAATTVLVGKFAINTPTSLPVLFLLSMVIGGLFGLLNGAIIVALRLPSIVVTLGSLNLIFGLMIWGTNGAWINGLPLALLQFGKLRLLPASVAIPVQGLILLVEVIILHFFLHYTLAGRGIYALSNKQAAQRLGFSVGRLTLQAFVIAGLIYGVSAFTHTSIVGQVDPNAFIGFELQVIATVVLGGVSLAGGVGRMRGVLLGVLLVAIVNNGLILIHLPVFWQKIFIGFVLLLSVSTDQIYLNRLARRRHSVDVEREPAHV